MSPTSGPPGDDGRMARDAAPHDAFPRAGSPSARAGGPETVEQQVERLAPRVAQIAALRLGRPLRSLRGHGGAVRRAMRKALRSLGPRDRISKGSLRDLLSRRVEEALRRTPDPRPGEGHATQEEPPPRGEPPGPSFPLEILVSGEDASKVRPDREATARVERALLSMDAPKREIILLSRLCELTTAEISRRLALPPPTLRVCLSRALRELEELARRSRA